MLSERAERWLRRLWWTVAACAALSAALLAITGAPFDQFGPAIFAVVGLAAVVAILGRVP